MSKDSIAILFFSRTFEDEFKAKNLGLSKEKFKSYYYYQVNRTISLAHQSGLAVFEHYSNEQKGNSFGERLSHALLSIKRQRFEQVIVIGNDTPLLTLNHLERAMMHLTHGRSVLGKDQHRGSWIIGFDLQNALILKIKSINWHKGHVYDELQQILPNVISLSDLLDLNHSTDLRLLLNSNDLMRSIKRFLASLKSQLKNFDEVREFEPYHFLVSHLHRGPPERL